MEIEDAYDQVMPSAGQCITVQFGNTSNFIGSLFWSSAYEQSRLQMDCFSSMFFGEKVHGGSENMTPYPRTMMFGMR